MIQADLFLNELQIALSISKEIEMSDLLEDLDDYDSLSQMTLISWLDQAYSVKVNMVVVSTFKKVSDIYNYLKANGVNI